MDNILKFDAVQLNLVDGYKLLNPKQTSKKYSPRLRIEVLVVDGIKRFDFADYTHY